MKILHIISHFDQGGAERVALNISKSKTPEIDYHIVEVVRTSGAFRKGIIQECLDNGINVYTSPIRKNKLAIVLFPFWLIFIMIRVRPNVIHTHTEIPDLSIYIWHTLFGWLFPMLKYVRTIHNTELWNEWKGIGQHVETFYKNVHANIAISESTRQCYQKEYAENTKIIYNGVSETAQKPFDYIIKGKINILFAGRLEHQKGIDELVQVINALKDDGRFVFHIVGDGSLKYMVEELKCYKCVHLYEKVYGLASYLSSFDYLFMPSNFEGLALMPIEASMAQTPTIINKCPGLHETLPENWPLAVDNNNVNDFLNIFKNIDKFDREMLGENAYAYVKEHFSLGKMQEEYERLYLQKVNYR